MLYTSDALLQSTRISAYETLIKMFEFSKNILFRVWAGSFSEIKRNFLEIFNFLEFSLTDRPLYIPAPRLSIDSEVK